MDPCESELNAITRQTERDTKVPSSLNIKCRKAAETGQKSLAVSIELRQLSHRSERSDLAESKSLWKPCDDNDASDPDAGQIQLTEENLDLGFNAPSFSHKDTEFFDSCLSSDHFLDTTELNLREENEFKKEIHQGQAYNVLSGSQAGYSCGFSEAWISQMESLNSKELPSDPLEEFSSFSFSLEDSSILHMSTGAEYDWSIRSENQSLQLNVAVQPQGGQYVYAGSSDQYIDPIDWPAKSPSAAISQSLAEVSLDNSFGKPTVSRKTALPIKRKRVQGVYIM